MITLISLYFDMQCYFMQPTFSTVSFSILLCIMPLLSRSLTAEHDISRDFIDCIEQLFIEYTNALYC
jgi:hypothetical protein